MKRGGNTGAIGGPVPGRPMNPVALPIIASGVFVKLTVTSMRRRSLNGVCEILVVYCQDWPAISISPPVESIAGNLRSSRNSVMRSTATHWATVESLK